MGPATNPILDEINGLSPGAKSALISAHTATSGAPPPSPQPDPGLQAPSRIPKTPMMDAPPPDPPAPGLGGPPPRGTLEGDQAERSRLLSTGSGISQIHGKIENSNLGKAHPFLGKLLGWGAEIPARAAEIGGSMLGPTAIAERFTPGTQLHHNLELSNLNNVIGHESEEGLQGAQAGNQESETKARDNPRPDYKPTDTVGGIMGYDSATNSFAPPTTPSGQPEMPYTKPGPAEHVVVTGANGKPVFANYQGGKFLDAQGQEIPNAKPYEKPEAPKSAEHVSLLGDDGKPTEGIFDPNTNTYKDSAGNVIHHPRPIPPPPSYGQLMLPTKTITAMVNGVPMIMQWDEKTQTYDKPAAQSASGAYAHEEEQAAAVQRMGEQVIGDLQANRASLGTLSAWVQKHGLNTPIADPKLAGLQSELAGFAALQPAMHGFRSHSALETFNNIIGGIQQNPDATIASIRGILKTAGNINPNLGGNGGGDGNAPKEGETKTNSAGDKIIFKGGKWGPA